MYNLQNIKKIAEEKRISIRELAEFCGKTAESLHGSIKNNNMHLETLDLICEYLGVSISELINQDVKGLKIEKIQITDANEYLVQRFEEIVKENVKLKDELRELKSKLLEKPAYGVASQPDNKLKIK